MSSIRDVRSGVPKRRYERALMKYFGSHASTIMATPDVVMVVEDWRRLVDEWALVAMELKYFKEVDRRRWRRAYREVGQALRYHLHGFDSTALLHVFSEAVDDVDVRAYSNAVGEVIERLKLPVVYFSVRMVDGEGLLAFKPSESRTPYNICSLATWAINCCMDTRNPLLPRDKEILERRRALKAALGVP